MHVITKLKALLKCSTAVYEFKQSILKAGDIAVGMNSIAPKIRPSTYTDF